METLRVQGLDTINMIEGKVAESIVGREIRRVDVTVAAARSRT